MKRTICGFVLIIILSSIGLFTIYTLKKQSVKENVYNARVTNKLKMTSSTMLDDNLSQVFTIYLNGLKHRLKIDYHVLLDQEQICTLTMYLDGKEIFSTNVINNVTAPSTKELFTEENIAQYVKLSEQNFEVIKTDEDYLAILLGFYNGKIEQKIYLINDKGKILNPNPIIYKNTNEYYIDSNNNELNIFYQDNQIMANIENNKIYSLEIENVLDNYRFLEYVYTIKNSQINKELINTYDYIKIKDEQNIE